MVVFCYRDPILDDLNACSQALDFCIGINADDLTVQPNTQVTLLLQKFEEFARLGFRRNSDPESDKNGRCVRITPAPQVGTIDIASPARTRPQTPIRLGSVQ